MTKFFSASTGGFYDTSVHGAHTMMVPDPDWIRPTKEVPDPDFQPTDDEPDAPMISVPDDDAEHPLIEVDNPDCKVPSDAVEISDDDHAALMEAQASGKVIKAGKKGKPVVADPEPPTDEQLAASARRKRDSLIAGSDWTQLTDASLTDAERAAWNAYRQALRDVPQQSGFPSSIDWPKPPK